MKVMLNTNVFVILNVHTNIATVFNYKTLLFI